MIVENRVCYVHPPVADSPMISVNGAINGLLLTAGDHDN